MRSETARKKWAVMISGRGSNLQSIIDNPEIDLSLVISSKKSAAGLVRAKRAGVPTMVLEKNINWEKLSIELKKRKVCGILLLGFMKIIPAQFVNEWTGRMFNIHPSLLPLYPGVGSLEKSFNDKAKMGVTFHEVTEGMDEGPRLAQFAITRAETLQRAVMLNAIAEQRLVSKMTERINLWI